jgi:hypothetical protein
MVKKLNILLCLLVLLSLHAKLYSQRDVTQFLGIPVDGYKSEMMQKLKNKGYTISPYNKDVLVGEFNGINVNIFIVTNNNKVYRIMVADANTIGETDIKIRFNRLLQQFKNNKNYLPSLLGNYDIPDDEDISHELLIKNKRYEAIFYQKPADYDSLNLEMQNIYGKETINDEDKDRLRVIKESMINLNKNVWFMITESNGKYSISMYYDNEYNRANGEGL